MATREIVLCEAVRTPIGTYDGSLKTVSAPDLGAIAIKAVLTRSKLDPAKVGTVVMGNVVQAGNKMNPARQSAVNSGIPVDVPAMTVNRVCGSGAQGIASAAQEVMLGMLDSAVAGGMENMDMTPYLVANGRWGYRMGDAPNVRQHVARWPQRRVFRRAFRVAHGRFGKIPPNHPRTTRSLGIAFAAAFFGSAGGREVQGRDYAGRNSQPQGAEGLRQGRKQQAGHHAGEPRQAPSGVSARTGRLPPAMHPV